MPLTPLSRILSLPVAAVLAVDAPAQAVVLDFNALPPGPLPNGELVLPVAGVPGGVVRFSGDGLLVRTWLGGRALSTPADGNTIRVEFEGYWASPYLTVERAGNGATEGVAFDESGSVVDQNSSSVAELTLQGPPAISSATFDEAPDGAGSMLISCTLLPVFADCNGNGTPDRAEISAGVEEDCNGNLVPDSCDVANGQDQNSNGVVDSCECRVIPYCQTSANSVGSGALMGAGGSAMISRNDFILLSAGLPTSQSGIFFYGPAQELTPLGNGFRCVGGQIERLEVVNSGPLGIAVQRVELLSQAPSPHNITAGSTWNFQFWYRDPLAGSAGFNLSDGLQVTFCP